MQYLRQRNCGFETAHGIVPIVSGAVVFDLGLNKSEMLPDADMGYTACENSSNEGVVQGCFGAGTGATVGKIFGFEHAMKGGQGCASFLSPEGLRVWALAVVNAYGDVRNQENGELLAGVRTRDGRGLADAATCLSTLEDLGGFSGTNTVLGVVATNAKLSKAELTRVAQMAQDGVARTVVPAHTLYDGDTIFALSTASYRKVEVTIVGALSAHLMGQAIVNGVVHATGVDGIPAYQDLLAGQ
jgi:L-aminopeptidase/D-esterase-like protein